MPNLPISQLPELTSIQTSAEFAVAQGGVTYRVKAANVTTGVLYGSFFSSLDQPITANVPKAMSADTVDLSSGISVVDGSKFTVSSGGTFNLQFSAQVAQTSNAAELAVWIRKNGADVSDSTTVIDLQNNSKYLFALNYYIELTAGQYVEVWWASSSANTTIEYLPLQTTPYNRPAVPSLIVTMSQI